MCRKSKKNVREKVAKSWRLNKSVINNEVVSNDKINCHKTEDIDNLWCLKITSNNFCMVNFSGKI